MADYMKNADSLPMMSFETRQGWEQWLTKHHADTKGIWLKIAKKESSISSVNYAEALDSALCYGWIDGQKASFDDRYWLQKFSPRRPKSMWSKVNCDKATALIAEGRMQPAGLRQVELAQADGRWDLAYESQSKITIPADFQSELDKNQQAKEFFSTLNSVNRYAILFRIQTAKKPETRTARIQKFIEMLSKNEKIYPS
ncbi:MAG: YdeI family protein [Ktedonobacteraceae bacterium]